MTREEFEELLIYPEDTCLDWKRDFPPGLLKDSKDPEWKKGKSKLLKALVSIANRDDERTGFLVYGVEDKRTHRNVVGISVIKTWDDSYFQSWANIFDPPIRFSYSELIWETNKKIGIFKIKLSPEYPHVARENIGEIHEGQVWFRRGSKNTVAFFDDLKNMFHSPKPFIITYGQKNGKVYIDVKNHYKDRGYELIQLPLARRDISLLEGYKIAYYPGTRREIQVEEPQSKDSYDILMMKMKNKQNI